MGRKATTLAHIFERSIPEPNSGCWLWLGPLSRDGRYGCCSYLNKTERAHRLAYLLAKGPIPIGLEVLHVCDVPLCVNPDHLFLGTNADNMRDKHVKGRQAKGVDCNHPHRVFDDEAVREVRRLRKAGASLITLAKLFQCSRVSIWSIVTNKTWSHVK